MSPEKRADAMEEAGFLPPRPKKRMHHGEGPPPDREGPPHGREGPPHGRKGLPPPLL